MVNLCGLQPDDAPAGPTLSEDVQKVNGIDIHAGLSETSRMMFIKPALVGAKVVDAPTHAAEAFPQLIAIAQKPHWPGYFGAPRLASAAHGAAVMRHRADLYIRSALQILDGRDERQIPRYATAAMRAEEEGVRASLAYDESMRKKQADWLKKHGIE